MKKKILALCLVVVLAVTAVTGATLAYFTDTATAKNTFTVGKVDIDLKEPNWTDNTQLVPGVDYKKDPTVTVLADSENCYVRMKVTVDVAALKATFPKDDFPALYGTVEGQEVFLLQGLVKGWDATKWECKAITATGTYEFWYTQEVADTDANQVLPALFTSVEIPKTAKDLSRLVNSEGKFIVDIVAEAIQADGFTNAANAWANWGI